MDECLRRISHRYRDHPIKLSNGCIIAILSKIISKKHDHSLIFPRENIPEMLDAISFVIECNIDGSRSTRNHLVRIRKNITNRIDAGNSFFLVGIKYSSLLFGRSTRDTDKSKHCGAPWLIVHITAAEKSIHPIGRLIQSFWIKNSWKYMFLYIILSFPVPHKYLRTIATTKYEIIWMIIIVI